MAQRSRCGDHCRLGSSERGFWCSGKQPASDGSASGPQPSKVVLTGFRLFAVTVMLKFGGVSS